MKNKKELLIRKSMEHLIEVLPEKMPPVGLCKPYFVWFEFPGTENDAHLCVEGDMTDKTKRTLLTRIVKSGTDICMINYMMHGTMDEIFAYLADQNNIAPLLESLQHLSDKMDDYDQ